MLRWLSTLVIILSFYDEYTDERGPWLIIEKLHPAIPRIDIKAITMPANNHPDCTERMLRLEFKSTQLHLTLDIGHDFIALNCR